MLVSVIKDSVGSPFEEKIAQVLQNYAQPNQFSIDTFVSKNFILIIGFKLNKIQRIIKYISVEKDFMHQGIGGYFI